LSDPVWIPSGPVLRGEPVIAGMTLGQSGGEHSDPAAHGQIRAHQGLSISYNPLGDLSTPRARHQSASSNPAGHRSWPFLDSHAGAASSRHILANPDTRPSRSPPISTLSLLTATAGALP